MLCFNCECIIMRGCTFWLEGQILNVHSLQHQWFLPFHTFPLLSLWVLNEVCKHVLVRACAHACTSEQFYFSLCVRAKADVKACAFSLPSLLCSGLSRGRMGAERRRKYSHSWFGHCGGGGGGEGEEHYSHWCSGCMAKTPRSFRKGAYSRLDVTQRTGLEDGCWAPL